jgi:hypothetical protein
MMTGYYGTGTGTSMMGGTSYGSYGWMMSQAGYQWMTGNGTATPGWMAGATLPAAMMSTGMMGGGMAEISGSLAIGQAGISACRTASIGQCPRDAAARTGERARSQRPCASLMMAAVKSPASSW